MSGSYSPSMTLGEAIQKMRESEDNLADQLSAEIKQALEQHDAVHIVFDCGTSIQDEIAVHLWMLLGTTADIGVMHRAVSSQEHRNVLAEVGHLQLLGAWLTNLPRIVQIIIKSLRMRKKLAVEELPELKQQSLIAIRQEHGILL